MPELTIRFNGLDKVVAALGQMSSAVRSEAARELNDTSEEIMTASKEMVPVDTGRLRSTGHVAEYATPRDLGTVLAYGTDYAIYVHENLSVHHPTGQAKFLERPFFQQSAHLPDNLARRLGRAFASGRSGFGFGGSRVV